MSVATLLSFEEALETVLAHASPLPSELVPVAEAAGRVLAEPALAAVDLPPFAASAMDGYAVRAADTPGRLDVVFRIAAGHPSPDALGQGEAMGIATGGVVPEGSDAVVPIEEVTETGDAVEVPASRPARMCDRWEGTSAAARRSPTRVSGSARLSSARSLLRGSPSPGALRDLASLF